MNPKHFKLNSRIRRMPAGMTPWNFSYENFGKYEKSSDPMLKINVHLRWFSIVIFLRYGAEVIYD